jgi:chromate transporter
MSTGTIEPAVERPSLGELVRVFGKIGLISFGGPAGQIALMHRVLVEEKKWLDEPRFLHALNYCMMLPGPEAMQLATYAGWLLHGVRGGLIAGLLFVLPGALVLIALSALYLALGEVTIVEGLLFGLKAAVLAIVLEALVKVSKRALKNSLMVAIAAVAFVGIAFLQIPFPVIILSAAAIGAMVHWMVPGGHGRPAGRRSMPHRGEASFGRFAATTAPGSPSGSAARAARCSSRSARSMSTRCRPASSRSWPR